MWTNIHSVACRVDELRATVLQVGFDVSFVCNKQTVGLVLEYDSPHSKRNLLYFCIRNKKNIVRSINPTDHLFLAAYISKCGNLGTSIQ